MVEWPASGDVVHCFLVVGAVILAVVGYRLFIFCYDVSLVRERKRGVAGFLFSGSTLGLLLLGAGTFSFLSLLYTNHSFSRDVSLSESLHAVLHPLRGTIPPAPRWPVQEDTVMFATLPESPKAALSSLEVVPEGEGVRLEDDDEIDFMIGLEFFHEQRFDEALSIFAALSEKSSSDGYRLRAEFYSGECSLALGEPDMAILHYQEVLEQGGSGEWVAGALFQQAEAFSQLGSTKLSRYLLSHLVERYPASVEGRVAALQLQAEE